MTASASAVRQVALAWQAAGAAGMGWVLVHWAGWPWSVALLAGLGAVFAGLAAGIALAFFLTLSGFGLSAGDRPPLPPALARERHPLGLAGWMRCFGAEYLAVARMFNWLQPMASGRPFAPTTSPRATVLLVHGYGCNHAVWLDMQPALAAAGYRCEAIDLTPVFGNIDDYAGEILARLRDIRARTGTPPLVVCHSMGGLAARAALALAGEESVCAGLVTLGAPHHGCVLARWGMGVNAFQMRCGSDWLRRLAATEPPARRARMVCVFSWHDSIAGPACTGWLPGARHVALSGLGHVSLLRHPRAVRAAVEALDTLAAPDVP